MVTEHEPTQGESLMEVILAIGMVIAILLASWNVFSISETEKELTAKDSDLASDISPLNALMSESISALDNA